MEKTKLQWHPAFGAALRITLQDEMRYLEMQEEIYYLKGDPIPMQILIAPKLSDKENYWLQSMRTNLRAGAEIRKLMSEYEKHRKSKDYAAVMDLITRANWEQMEVEKKMCDALKELFAEELKEADRRYASGINTGHPAYQAGTADVSSGRFPGDDSRQMQCFAGAGEKDTRIII